MQYFYIINNALKCIIIRNKLQARMHLFMTVSLNIANTKCLMINKLYLNVYANTPTRASTWHVWACLYTGNEHKLYILSENKWNNNINNEAQVTSGVLVLWAYEALQRWCFIRSLTPSYIGTYVYKHMRLHLHAHNHSIIYMYLYN